MKTQELSFDVCKQIPPCIKTVVRRLLCGAVIAAGVVARTASASENVPQLPFAEFADVPEKGQFIVGALYEQSKSYQIWAGGQQYGIKVRSGGENYGIDIRQGFFILQYGITEKWAADLEIGATTVGWRAFSGRWLVPGTA